MNYCKVIMGGNLCHDPELKYTPSGAAVTTFNMAVNHRYKDKEDVAFVDVECWQKTAEMVAEYCKKGKNVLVEGRLKQDRWETKDGQKRSKLLVVADRVVFVGKREESREEDIPV